MQRDVIVVEGDNYLRAGHLDADEDEEVVGEATEEESWFETDKARQAAIHFQNSTYDFFLKFSEPPSGTQRIEGC